MKAISKGYKLSEELVLPYWLYYEREDELLVHAAIRHDNVTRIKETFSRFHNLYDTIESARFNLLATFNKKVIEDLTSDETDELFVQIQFINNSIQWYNNSFDILLQSLWIYYGIYKNDCDTKKKSKTSSNTVVTLTTETLPIILSTCNYNKVRVWLLAKNSPLCEGLEKTHNTLSLIHKWANTFKHRGNINYLDNSIAELEVKVHSVDDESKVWYDSSHTKEAITIDQCIEEFVSYHKEIVEYSRKITEEFKLYFRTKE